MYKVNGEQLLKRKNSDEKILQFYVKEPHSIHSVYKICTSKGLRIHKNIFPHHFIGIIAR